MNKITLRKFVVGGLTVLLLSNVICVKRVYCKTEPPIVYSCRTIAQQK